jgi:hypothetical protein
LLLFFLWVGSTCGSFSFLPCTFDGWVLILDFYLQGFSWFGGDGVNNWESEFLCIIIMIIIIYHQAMWYGNKIQKSFFVCKWKKSPFL